MIKHFNIRVSGKVQGVFFRASTKDEAERLNITGFVQNEADGSVYIEAEGSENNMLAFIAWCKQGPTVAHVTHCEIIASDLVGFNNFMIRRD